MNLSNRATEALAPETSSPQPQEAWKVASETAAARRERLIVENMRQVRIIARRLYRMLGRKVCFEDLVSAGTLGLIAAVDNFQESNGFKLSTYAERRIRGAILDSVRGLDWASRAARKKSKQLERAIDNLEQRLKRSPTTEEIAADRSFSIPQCHERKAEAHALRLDSLDAPVHRNRAITLGSLLPDSIESLPSVLAERSERDRLLREAVNTMPAINRAVLTLSYFEELPRRDVASAMGIDVKLVTKLKEGSMKQLRQKVTAKFRCPAPSPAARRYAA